MKAKIAAVAVVAGFFWYMQPGVLDYAEADLENFYRDNHIYNVDFPCEGKTIDGRHFIKCVSALYEAKPVGDEAGYRIYTVNGRAGTHYEAYGRVANRLDELVDIPSILAHFD